MNINRTVVTMRHQDAEQTSILMTSSSRPLVMARVSLPTHPLQLTSGISHFAVHSLICEHRKPRPAAVSGHTTQHSWRHVVRNGERWRAGNLQCGHRVADVQLCVVDVGGVRVNPRHRKVAISRISIVRLGGRKSRRRGRKHRRFPSAITRRVCGILTAPRAVASRLLVLPCDVDDSVVCPVIPSHDPVSNRTVPVCQYHLD